MTKAKPVEEKTYPGLKGSFSKKHRELLSVIDEADVRINRLHEKRPGPTDVNFGDFYRRLKLGFSFLNEHHLEMLKRENEQGLVLAREVEARESKIEAVERVLKRVEALGLVE